jgi:GST-like protein
MQEAKPMIHLYGMSSPNVFKITILLEECALPYRVHYVNVFAGQQFEPEFLRISPNNKVPVIVDEQGPGGGPFSVFESGAILLYLARKSGSNLLPADPAVLSVVEQWLIVQLASIGPMFGQCVHFLRHAPDGSDYGRQRYTSEVKRLCAMLDHRLQDSRFLGGSDYSLADVATFPWIRTATKMFPWLRSATPTESPPLGIPSLTARSQTNAAADDGLSPYPALRSWYSTIAARPAVQRGIQAGESFLPNDVEAFKSADADAFDRFFGRGPFAHQLPESPQDANRSS